MKTNLLPTIAKALRLHKLFRKRGWMHMNELVYVTHETWAELNHHPAQSYCRTRTFPDNQFKEDFDTPAPSRRPMIREIWVGARSLDALVDPHKEDEAEMSDYAWMLYYDPEFDGPAIDDPETGERRPIRAGDIIQTARGSNDDLDDLFADELNDPRPERDDLVTERFPGAPDYIEHAYTSDEYDDLVATPDGGMRLATFRNTEAVFHRNALPCFKEPDDLEIAIEAAESLGEAATQREIDAVAQAIRKKLAADFVDADRYFVCMDRIQAENVKACTCKKKGPSSVDWGAIRTKAEKIARNKKLKKLLSK